MSMFLTVAVVLLLALTAIGYFADKRQRGDDKRVGLSLLPGDIEYQSPSGNVRFYFPVTTSIVLSLVLTLLMRFLG